MINVCKGICTLKNGQCIGCKRTEEEISDWWDYDDEKQERLAKELEDRESKDTNNRFGRPGVSWKKRNESSMKIISFKNFIKNK